MDIVIQICVYLKNYVCLMFDRPLRDDEVLPVRTHRIVLESGDMADVEGEEVKPKKKHKKVKDKEDKKKHRKDGKEKVC